MSGSRLATVLVLLGSLVSTGCISFSGNYGTPISQEHLPLIRDGESTRAEILAWFGPPSALYNPTFLDVVLEDEDDITASTGPILDDVYTYRFIQNDSTFWFIPIFYASLEAGASSETLTIFFDEEGRVKYHAYRRDGVAGAAEMRRILPVPGTAEMRRILPVPGAAEMRRILLVVLASWSLTGCAEALFSRVTMRTHAAYSDADFARFLETCQTGSSRKGDVMAALGPPNQVLAQDRGDVFVYRRSARDTDVVNLNPSMVSGFGPTVPFPIFFRSSRSGREDSLMLFFDEQGVFVGESLVQGIDPSPEGVPR